MTQGRRIFLNVVATYGRSLYSMVIGLFCGRWMLKVLGEVDYGLLGVIGGMVAFMTFVNTVLASSVSRFYGYSVGQERIDETLGVELCRQWFNVALFLHLFVPMIIVLVGYPVGIWTIENHLTIPVNRIPSCVWIWRFVMISAFVTMASVPFQAMYYAKQEIAELTIYSVATVTIKTVALYWMLTHPGFWLVKYAFLSSALIVMPQLIVVVRAMLVYPECRFRKVYLWDLEKLKELFKFSVLRFASMGTMMIGNSGSVILVNKLLGPAKNAAATIGSMVSAQSSSLSGAISGAFSPAITNAAGAGDLALMKRLAYRASSFGTIAVLIFVLPLVLEIKMVMTLWLDAPPLGSAELCVCYLIVVVLERISDGHWMSFYAVGRIYGYQISEALSWLVMLPTSYILMKWGFDIKSIGISIVFVKLFTTGAKVYFARKECGLSVVYWLNVIVLPLVLASLVSIAAGWLSLSMFEGGIIRICITTLATNSVFLPLCWFFVLKVEDRKVVTVKVKTIFEKLVGRKSK